MLILLIQLCCQLSFTAHGLLVINMQPSCVGWDDTPSGSSRHLSTWQMTAASSPTALSTLCGQMTFWLAWCHEHSVVTMTKFLQLLDLACGTLPVQLCNAVITYGLYRWQLNGHLFLEAWTWRSVTPDMQRLRKTLTNLLTAVTTMSQKQNTDQCIMVKYEYNILHDKLWSFWVVALWYKISSMTTNSIARLLMCYFSSVEEWIGGQSWTLSVEPCSQQN